MNTAIVVQARMGSTRLPGKVIQHVINEHSVLDLVLERIAQSQLITQVILATTILPQDDLLVEYAQRRRIAFVRGSEQDVLSRYILAADRFHLEALVRITSDCPLIEPALIDRVVARGWEGKCDYVSTAGYPRGSGDVEFVTTWALRKANRLAGERTFYREHVTTYLLDHPQDFTIEILTPPPALNRPEIRLCVDEMADLELVRQVYQYFSPRTNFGVDQIIAFLDAHPRVAMLNHHVKQKTE